MSGQQPSIFTIGHSTHSREAFVTLLKRHCVTAIADVRSAPYSHHNPQFNREDIRCTLRAHDIKYVFLGLELGARSDDKTCYENGRVQYTRLAATQLFDRGIKRIMRGAREHRIAIMCAEKNPLECHRTLLVSRALDEKGVTIYHILGNGELEAHKDTMEKLLDIAGLPHEDFFRPKEELIAHALAIQEERIAYVDKTLVTDATRAAR